MVAHPALEKRPSSDTEISSRNATVQDSMRPPDPSGRDPWRIARRIETDGALDDVETRVHEIAQLFLRPEPIKGRGLGDPSE